MSTRKRTTAAGATISVKRRCTPQEYQVAHEVIANIILRGMQMGDLVADFLDGEGYRPSNKGIQPIPTWLAYDLSIALQIASWERAGLIHLFPETLPRSTDLVDRIKSDMRNAEAYKSNLPDFQLGRRVISIFRKFLAHQQPIGLRTEFHLDRPDPDELVEALAQFLVS